MILDLKTNIIHEVELSISAQIKEISITLTAQVKNAIKDRISQRSATINQEDIEMKLEANHELITQES